jgi:transposase-like protein
VDLLLAKCYTQTAETQSTLRNAEKKNDRITTQDRRSKMSARKRYNSRFKAQVALEAIKNQQTIAQIASEYGIHPNQVTRWKQQALQDLPEIFADGRSKKDKDNEQLVSELYRQIGQLKVELTKHVWQENFNYRKFNLSSRSDFP